MGVSSPPKVALVWRAETPATLEESRFAPVAAALRDAGFAPEACAYDEHAAPAVRGQLLSVDAALVWVNPLQDGRRRYELDSLLRDVAVAGVLVSAHPDVVDKMGVKAVLWRTRELGWGSDVHFHPEPRGFAEAFPARLAAGPRVLKPNRGNGGQGVWRVELAGEGRAMVQTADGDPTPRSMPVEAVIEAREADFREAGGLVDQAFQPRLTEGMVRCYMAGDRVAGFGHQQVRALAAPEAGAGGPRLYSGPEDRRFQRLRGLMEEDWTPGLMRLLDIARADLPVIWDADFLLGPTDGYVLCEINASSVFPIPAEAPGAIAKALARTFELEDKLAPTAEP